MMGRPEFLPGEVIQLFLLLPSSLMRRQGVGEFLLGSGHVIELNGTKLFYPILTG